MQVDSVSTNETAVDEWSLTTDQMVFMLQYHNQIETAYAAQDLDYLRELAASGAFQAIFGDMSFDEAYDRYECTLEAKHEQS